MYGEREEILRYLHLDVKLDGREKPYLRGKRIQQLPWLQAYIPNKDNVTKQGRTNWMEQSIERVKEMDTGMRVNVNFTWISHSG